MIITQAHQLALDTIDRLEDEREAQAKRSAALEAELTRLRDVVSEGDIESIDRVLGIYAARKEQHD